MSSKSEFDVIMVGHFAKDRLIVDGHEEIASGGAVYYGGIALRRIGIRVAIVTRLHRGDFPRLDELRKEGVVVFATAAGDTSGIANYYRSDDMERRVCRPLGFAGPIHVSELPEVGARVLMAAPIIAGEIELNLLQEMARRAPVALDVQGFVRVREGDTLAFGAWPDMARGLASVKYLKVDRAEAEALTGMDDLERAAHRLAEYGPSEIVLTESAGVTVLAEGRVYRAPFMSRSLAGRTGRGDTCFATYVGARLGESAAEATRLAAAVTSLKQEQPGPWRGTMADVRAALELDKP